MLHGFRDWGRDIAFGNSQANIETAIYYQCLQVMERFERSGLCNYVLVPFKA
jgi:hypothetical protein